MAGKGLLSKVQAGAAQGLIVPRLQSQMFRHFGAVQDLTERLAVRSRLWTRTPCSACV